MLRDGYKKIGEIKNERDVRCLHKLFIYGDMQDEPEDMENILRCARKIINIIQPYSGVHPDARRTIEELEEKIKLAKPVSANPLIIPSQPCSDWDLMI